MKCIELTNSQDSGLLTGCLDLETLTGVIKHISQDVKLIVMKWVNNSMMLSQLKMWVIEGISSQSWQMRMLSSTPLCVKRILTLTITKDLVVFLGLEIFQLVLTGMQSLLGLLSHGSTLVSHSLGFLPSQYFPSASIFLREILIRVHQESGAIITLTNHSKRRRLINMAVKLIKNSEIII